MCLYHYVDVAGYVECVIVCVCRMSNIRNGSITPLLRSPVKKMTEALNNRKKM